MPQPLTVAELTRQIKDCLEGNFPFVAVLGELSSLTVARSGHVFVTLKDDDAQLKAVMWRSRAARLRFELHDGLEVVAIGRVEVYPPRGTYQLVIEELVPQGIGPLELAFRQLQEKLAKEGLFSDERKRLLPRFPRRIALITSPTGAAIRDMLQVLTRRWRSAELVILPVPVQGDGAAAQIAAAVRNVHRTGAEVAIVGRGGGSLEDLWAFNEEVLARAICECRIPIVSAVGHEVDVTIADLVADRRALTPSEAAELVVPDSAELALHLSRAQERLATALRRKLVEARSNVAALAARPAFARPQQLIEQRHQTVRELGAEIQRSVRRVLDDRHNRLAAAAGRLEALSPLAVLARGYSVTTLPDGTVVKDADAVRPGAVIATRLQRGTLTSRVDK